MRIPNPIYDIVFKYLMEDKEAAKLLLSRLIEEDIEALDFLPKEKTARKGKDTGSMTVYRLDFSAKIKLKESGCKNVIIEIQKAKFSSDIMRFRRYLGSLYSDKKNVYEENGITKALPIISVYFLGYSLDNIDCPVIKVKRQSYNSTTGEKILEKEDFIESLTHDSFIVQICRLKQPYRSETERLFSIFDQNLKIDDHTLEIDESQYPDKGEILIRRLLRASAEKEVIDTMDIEDEVIADLENLERKLEKKDKTIEERDRIIEEKDKALREKEKEIEALLSRFQGK